MKQAGDVVGVLGSDGDKCLVGTLDSVAVQGGEPAQVREPSPPARIDPLSLTRSGPHLDRAFVVAVCAR